MFLGAGVETYLTVNEVALLLKLSVVTIRRYTMRNEIPFHKKQRAVRYKKSEIEQWFDEREVAKAEENNGVICGAENNVCEDNGGNV